MIKFDDRHFFKYITVSEEEKKLGIYLLGAGHTDVEKRIEYPLKGHPVHHYFEQSEGRRLSDYQILYIIDGEGVFESELSGLQQITGGDMFVLFPEIWHRFSPKSSTGWKEYWVEFNGKVIIDFVKAGFLDPSTPVLKLGLNNNLTEKFINILEHVKNEDLTLQYSVSGMLYSILTQIFAIIKFNFIENSVIEKQIKCAKLSILENLCNSISPETLAYNIGISYSLLRKEFKRLTGFSPIQYQIQLRIQKSKNLLSGTDLSIKEIACQIGFDSNNYFSRIFRQKVGITPAEFRLRNKR